MKISKKKFEKLVVKAAKYDMLKKYLKENNRYMQDYERMAYDIKKPKVKE
ncbi:MAG: hypothetical protein II453_05440 [Alphaproteobacteria bacterium]|jgi:hypothetical protein|nr:hypothetical protein [Alphaproteobacteria bacterium]